MAVLLCTVVLLTRETETPESLITAIKTGSPSKRWQKAFELSNELNRDPAMIRSGAVMKEVIHVLKDRAGYDARTRSYMAIALSRFESEEAGAALYEALKEETEEEVQLYLLWGLGQKQYLPARKDIEPFLASPQEDLKKMASYVLGALGDPQSVPALLPLVDDESRDVRWNAALALARLGNDAGYAELVKMTDRSTLAAMEIPADKVEEVMVNAVKGLGLLKRADAMPILEELSKSDSSLKVRQAALEVLETTKRESLS
ncbi:MAG TPA: HEAT repeat domain-containing protein [Verrucomicrobiae bacterium]|nr:HEAT repeat domain-containing protein [Verrucomicrobiae bacterium]